MISKLTLSSRDEFENIKAEMLALDAELERLLAPPQVFATVLEVAPKPRDSDADQNFVVTYGGELFEVEAPPGMDLKASDDVIVDLVAKRVCRN